MYPVDRRRIAARVYAFLHSLRKAAGVLDVSHSTVARWLKDQSGKSYDASKRRALGKERAVTETIRAAVASNPLLSCRGLVDVVKATLSLTISRELARAVLAKQGMTRKKARFYGHTQDLPSKTDAFLRTRDAHHAEGRTFWSLDETSFGRHGAPVYGYAPRGRPLRVRRKVARVTTTSAMVIANASGAMFKECRAGSFNTDSFVAFLRRLDLPSDATILLDNVSFHHSHRAREVADERGWKLLFVPPYSPWFNPIEGLFSIVKRAWYAGATVQEAFDRVTPACAAAMFRSALSRTCA